MTERFLGARMVAGRTREAEPSVRAAFMIRSAGRLQLHAHPVQWLREKAAILQTTAGALGGRVATRLRHNSRGLNDYATHFPSKAYEVLTERKFYVSFGDVRISILPDLHVREKTRE